MTITYKGPLSPLYTHGRAYTVVRETSRSWIIKDNQGYATAIGKEFNVYWEVDK